jgi:uncharacterized protein (DUF427 family)
MDNDDLKRARDTWQLRGQVRPDAAVQPGPGQESVWDYPRLPAVEWPQERVRVAFAGTMVADSTRAARVLQLGIPPVYYLPPEDVRSELLVPSDHHSFCSLKGQADYWTVRVGERSARNAAWSYPDSPDEVTPAGYVAFYAHLLDACLVDDEKATAPTWSWLGGWVTARVVGPFMSQEDWRAGS